MDGKYVELHFKSGIQWRGPFSMVEIDYVPESEELSIGWAILSGLQNIVRLIATINDGGTTIQGEISGGTLYENAVFEKQIRYV